MRAGCAATWLLMTTIAGPSWAGDRVSLGLGAGVSADLDDRASAGETRFSAGPSLVVPLRVQLVPSLRFRIDVRLESGFGVDQLTWSQPVDDGALRLTDDDSHGAFLGAVALEGGFDVSLPVQGPAVPYVMGGLGFAVVGNYHALRGGSAVLLDPDQNDLGNPRNVDPYTVQVAALASLGLGVNIRVFERVDLWVETGYAAAFIAPRTLRKTPPELDARREAFAWNPIRAGAGFQVRL